MIEKWLKKFFLPGFLTVVPIAITFWVLKVLVLWADEFTKSYVPQRWHPENLLGFDIPGIGIVATIVLLTLVGAFTRFYLGKKLIEWGERLLAKIPVGRTIYSGIKQFLTSTMSDKKSFQKVALFEYPRKGLYVLGLVTNEAVGALDATDGKVFNVFVPTTPNPTSGFLILVPEKELRFLNITVEDAFKIIISGGVVSTYRR